MAKFCGNCGAQISDDAAVCGYCGVPVNGEAPVQGTDNKNPLGKIPGLENVNVDKDKVMKIVKIAAPALAAVVVLIIAISVIVNNTGWKGAVKKIEKAYNKGEYEILVDMIPSYISDDEDYEAEDMEESLSDRVDGVRDYFEEELDSDKYNVKIEVRSNKELSDKQKKELFEGYGYDKEDAEDFAKAADKIVKVKGKMIAEYKKDTEKRDVEYYLIKEDGGWKLAWGGYYGY